MKNNCKVKGGIVKYFVVDEINGTLIEIDLSTGNPKKNKTILKVKDWLKEKN